MYSPFKSRNDVYIDKSSGFVPTEQQSEAIALIKTFLTNPTEKIFVLKGYAGTGKTTLVNYVLKDFYKKGRLIAVTSFTNKATNVITRKTPFAEGITLFKLLGLKTDESSENLSFEKKGTSLVSNFDIIVLDEVSMVNDEHLDLLLKEINQMFSRTKLLIMGDPCQLMPIGQEEDSKAFKFENSFELTQVIRQSKDSNILKYSFCIREISEKINSGEKIPIKTKLKPEELSGANDLIILDNSKKFIEMMLEDFSSDEYKNSSDYVKVIAYRNNTIDKVNSLIRGKIFGEFEDTIVKGESIGISSPVIDDTGFVLYDPSDELEVTDILESEIYDSDNHCGLKIQFPYYNCLVSRKYDGQNGEMKIINPSHKSKFAELMTEWGKRIKKEQNAKYLFKEFFYPFKKKFHAIRYNYAQTSHSAQGSTFSKVYFVEDDVENVTKASWKDLWKSKYVAITRASKQLVILNRNK